MSRVQMSSAQFALFQSTQGARGRGTGKPAASSRRRKEDLPENVIAAQVIGFLRAQGFTCSRQQSGLFAPAYDADKRIRVGEKGCCDWRVERALNRPGEPFLHQLWYLEVKAPGKEPSPVQRLWMDRRTKTGTPCKWTDGYDEFRKWYRENFG